MALRCVEVFRATDVKGSKKVCRRSFKRVAVKVTSKAFRVPGKGRGVWHFNIEILTVVWVLDLAKFSGSYSLRRSKYPIIRYPSKAS